MIDIKASPENVIAYSKQPCVLCGEPTQEHPCNECVTKMSFGDVMQYLGEWLEANSK